VEGHGHVNAATKPARVGRLLAVVAIALVVVLGSGGAPAKAATSEEVTFETVTCIIAKSAYDYASDQLVEAPEGSKEEKYWQRQTGYWAGYMVGLGC
jgi:hypothetical protein